MPKIHKKYSENVLNKINYKVISICEYQTDTAAEWVAYNYDLCATRSKDKENPI